MKRRKAVSTLLWGMCGVIVAPTVLLTACQSKPGTKAFLTEDDVALLDEAGETIIPATASSPGARAAGIGAFMKVYVTDCYTKEDQEIFREGLIQIRKLSKSKFGKEFVHLSGAQKHDLFKDLDTEAQAYNRNRKKGDPDHYFSMIRKLTSFGYFTSKPGATKALRYVQTPGSFNGNLAYKKGDKAWAL